MNINLYKNWYLKSDPMNYILYEKRIVDDPNSKNNGNEYEQVEGYFTSIENALTAMCRREIRSCKCTTLNGLLKEVKILEKLIKELCQEIGADAIVANILEEYRNRDKMLEEKGEEIKAKEQAVKKKRGRPKKQN